MSDQTDSMDSPDVSVTVNVVNGSEGSDPGDDTVAGEPNSWTQVETDPARFVGYYVADRVRMPGGAERTSDGRYRVYVKSPTRPFWENANQLLVPAPGLVEGAYMVDLPGEELPATLTEGIEAVEQLMVPDVDRDEEASGPDDGEDADQGNTEE